MRIFLFILLIAVLAILYLAYFAPFPEPKAAHMRLKVPGQIAALEISSISVLPSSNISYVDKGQMRIDNQRLFELLSAAKDNVVNRAGTDWKQLRRFTDPWSNNYIFFVETITNQAGQKTFLFKARSTGPNGVDEGGKGDDITGSGVKLDELPWIGAKF